MAQIKEKPLLSICIPIYNRLSYLERMLERFYEEKELFDSKIELFISDNCSEDDLQSCCNRFSEMGLRLNYHRNDTNLGMDGNFINCFKYANGKYVLLLGSDDIPQKESLKTICELLSQNYDYGLLHLSGESSNKSGSLVECDNSNSLFEELNIWLTFISENIVKTEYVKDIDFDKYRGSLISQVPLYLHALLSSSKNAVYYANVFDEDNDSKNNGGYNLFQVFVENFLTICKEYVDKGFLSNKSFERGKKLAFENWLVGFIDIFLIKKQFKTNKQMDFSNSWSIILRHYGKYPYMYITLLKCVIKGLLKRN